MNLVEWCKINNTKIIEEWNYQKNLEINIDEATTGMHRKVWWKCDLGHEWEAMVSNRVKGRGCPYCANKKVLVGYNDLETNNPELSKEWHPVKNGFLKPCDIVAGSNSKIWWKCVKGHEWEEKISNRINGRNCPICSTHRVLAGYNDLATTAPNLLKEWNYDKNKISPTEVSKSSNKKVWWKCSNFHEWEATINSRYIGRGCPFCTNRKVQTGENDLASTKIEMLLEWNYEKNNQLGVTPDKVVGGSNKKVWWKCKKGHEWLASLNNRTSKQRGCPYCSNQKILVGFNDLQTCYPELMDEWNYERNTIKPSEITSGTNKKVWWKCKKGHEWEGSVNGRTGKKKSGCPVCKKETQTSFPEQAIYFYIKRLFPDAINSDREIIKPLELDIYIPSIKVAVEYDGEAWHKSLRKDELKVNKCNEKNIKLYRIRENNCPTLNDNECVAYYYKHNDYEELNIIIDKLLNEINGMNTSIDIKRDTSLILEQYVLNQKKNSIKEVCPEILSEWDYEKNAIKPEYVKEGSGKKVWWKCRLGHEWQASPNHRISKKTGCPYCSNQKLLVGFNDLQTCYPELVKEWDYNNNIIKPTEITKGTNKKVWWICSVCKSTWQSSVVSRTRNGVGCRKCGSIKAAQSRKENYVRTNGSLFEVFPDLKEEWNFEKNNNKNIDPQKLTKGSSEKVWWICKRGHEWEVAVNTRTNGRTGCPYCSGRYAIPGENDIATTCPELMLEWNYDKNVELLPSMIKRGSNKYVWWKCINGHEWRQTPNNRYYKKTGCPMCSKI